MRPRGGPPAPLLVSAKTIVTCDTGAAQCGVTFAALGRIEDGCILVDPKRGTVTALGSRAEIESRLGGTPADEIDFGDCTVVPGLVDAHAHPLFAGDREADFAARGHSEIAPLGMAHTIRQTRRALEEPRAFWELIRTRLHLMLAHGTTTLETKTGYALNEAGESALLALVDAHKNEPALPRLIATFLGAHALPPEFRDEADYVDYLIERCLPAAKAHGAVYADAFCEPGWFSPVQSRRYLEAARALGLRLRVHCDELGFGAAAEMAANLGVDAVDHCNYIREQDVGAIVARGIVMVACPATVAYLDLPRHAPVRALLERGGVVALASDFNPGTSPCFNLQTVAYFGRKLFGLSAAEALYGVTRAAAASLRADAGSLYAGGPADFVVLRIASPEEFGWQFGGNLAAAVVRAGKVVA